MGFGSVRRRGVAGGRYFSDVELRAEGEQTKAAGACCPAAGFGMVVSYRFKNHMTQPAISTPPMNQPKQ
jgi:hypothetical protein